MGLGYLLVRIWLPESGRFLRESVCEAENYRACTEKYHNFFDHQLEDGYIPMMIEVADWPEPYLNMRHKEGKIMNMHKPFLCSQMCLISDYTGDYSWTEDFLPGVAKYFDCYDHYYFHENSGLYVWQDDIMISMDNDPATFGRPPFHCKYLSEQLYVRRA